RSLPMPTNWLPWPGKVNAMVDMVQPHFQVCLGHHRDRCRPLCKQYEAESRHSTNATCPVPGLITGKGHSSHKGATLRPKPHRFEKAMTRVALPTRGAMVESLIISVLVFAACMVGIQTRLLFSLASIWPANAVLFGLLILRPVTNNVV